MSFSLLVTLRKSLHWRNAGRWSLIFKGLNHPPVFVADLMLFYVEQAAEYTLTYGDMGEQYCDTLGNSFSRAMKFIFMHGLLLTHYKRIEKLLERVNSGWGLYDVLSDIYHQYR